jgi:hypothetical protein
VLLRVIATGLLGFGLSAAAMDSCAIGEDLKNYKAPDAQTGEPPGAYTKRVAEDLAARVSGEISAQLQPVNGAITNLITKVDDLNKKFDKYFPEGNSHDEPHTNWHTHREPIRKIVRVYRYYEPCCCPPWGY